MTMTRLSLLSASLRIQTGSGMGPDGPIHQVSWSLGDQAPFRIKPERSQRIAVSDAPFAGSALNASDDAQARRS